MAKYTVTIDTGYGERAYDEITVEAETAAKAKYKVSKLCPGLPFHQYLWLFKPIADKVADDAPCYWKKYVEYKGEFKLRWIGKAEI